MPLTISDTTMTSEHSAHTARHAPDRNGWEVSRLPGRLLTRNSAVTAMVLADAAGSGDMNAGNRLWPHMSRDGAPSSARPCQTPSGKSCCV